MTVFHRAGYAMLKLCTKIMMYWLPHNKVEFRILVPIDHYQFHSCHKIHHINTKETIVHAQDNAISTPADFLFYLIFQTSFYK